MRRQRFTLALSLALIVSAVLCGMTAGAQESIIDGRDISKLMTAARTTYDLSNEDAVILFDGEKDHLMADGRLIKYVHRIIWIGTDVAIGRYGDHRIAYDDAGCKFNVIALRTWRDNQWWETGPTGIVETLPFELKKAVDYANMREVILLHNGIELPCILEVAYSIEDKTAFRAGAEGIWMFAREDPVVVSRLELGLPKGKSPTYSVSEGVPQLKLTYSDDKKLDLYSCEMGPLPARGYPHTIDPAAYTPHVVWSTWKEWKHLGDYLRNVFSAAMRLDSSLTQAFDSLLENAHTDIEKIEKIAAFINDKTTFIDYPESYWWPSPRPASRTYATAYGHRLDRAILASSLFSRAGVMAQPAFIGSGYGSIDEGVPTLSQMNGIGVWVSGKDIEAYYDPSKSSVAVGLTSIFNRSIWLPGVEDKPNVRLRGENGVSQFEASIHLICHSDKDTITGTGFVYATDVLNPYGRMTGLKEQSKSFLGLVASGIIKKADIVEYNLSRFDLFNVTAGFKFTLKKPEKDSQQRIPIIIGEPGGGIFDQLGGDTVFCAGKRTSPIILPGPMHQKVELRLDLAGMEAVYLPVDQSISNEAGNFKLTVLKKDEQIVITRELSLSKAGYKPEEWPALRALFLADRHERNQTILLSESEDADAKGK